MAKPLLLLRRMITCMMRGLGISKEQSLEFIKRQELKTSLNPDQIKSTKGLMEKWKDGSHPYSEEEDSAAFWFLNQKAKAVSAATKLLKEGFSFRSNLLSKE